MGLVYDSQDRVVRDRIAKSRIRWKISFGRSSVSEPPAVPSSICQRRMALPDDEFTAGPIGENWYGSSCSSVVLCRLLHNPRYAGAFVHGGIAR